MKAPGETVDFPERNFFLQDNRSPLGRCDIPC